MPPAFSVIVPAYNAAATLPEAARSLDLLEERDFEVVIVNDGSQDATGDIADRLCRDRPGWQVIHQENRGLPAARNRAIAAASGRWLALLDSDDWFLPWHLTRMRQMLESGDDVGLAFVDAWSWHEGLRRFARRGLGQPWRPEVLPQDPETFFVALFEENFIFVGACAPRAIVVELGGFDESLRAAEDWNMWLRIVGRGYRAAGTGERTAVYRRSAGQMSADPQRMFDGRLSALRGALAASRLSPATVAAAEERIARLIAMGPGAEDVRHPLVDAAARLTRWASPVRDYRLRAPREIRGSLGEIR